MMRLAKLSKISLMSLAVGTLLCAAVQTQAVVSFQTVALMGDEAPGLEYGYVFSEGFGAPVINNMGEVAFAAKDNSGKTGIWVWDQDLFRLAAYSGDQAPGADPDVFLSPATRSDVFPLILNDNGRVAFKTNLAGSTVRGIWSEGAGTLHKVMYQNDQVPGMTSGVVFLDQAIPLFNNAGQTVFYSEISGPGIEDSNRHGLWIDNGGTLSLIARSGDPAPGLPSGVLYGGSGFFSGISGTTLTDNGRISFSGLISGPGIDDTNHICIWSGSAGSLELKVQMGNQAPGLESGATFSSFDDIAINSAGQMVFKGSVTGTGVDPYTNSHGIWADVDGSLDLIVRQGDVLTDILPNAAFNRIDNPVINASGQIAFYGGTENTNGLVRVGYWQYSEGNLKSLVTSSDHAAGTGQDVVFKDFEDFWFSDSGQYAFIARLNGTGIDTTNDIGLWVSDTSGITHLVAREGDLFDVNDDPLIDDLRTIDVIETVDVDYRISDKAGMAKVLNANGQITYKLTFTDGTEGVFVATVGLAGDLNSDGYVGMDDLDIILNHWNQTVDIGDALAGDYDGDGYVGLGDLDSVLSNWNTGTPPASVDVIPEPGVGLVMILGVPWVMRRRYLRGPDGPAC